MVALDRLVDVARVGRLDHRRRPRASRRRGRASRASCRSARRSRASRAAAARRSDRCARARAPTTSSVARVEAEVLVALERLAAAALEQPAVEEDRRVLRANEVLRPGDGLRGADELDVHAGDDNAVRFWC